MDQLGELVAWSVAMTAKYVVLAVFLFLVSCGFLFVGGVGRLFYAGLALLFVGIAVDWGWITATGGVLTFLGMWLSGQDRHDGGGGGGLGSESGHSGDGGDGGGDGGGE